jgi:DNA-binding LacI/PurR family transcriptional regulator
VDQGLLVTMADLAVSAGASSRDVALVLAGDTRVPADVHRRIADTIESTGYRPFQAVQAQLGRPLRLAIVFKTYGGDDPEANRFYTPIAAALELMCARHGTEIVRAMMAVDDHYELADIPDVMQDGRTDGAFVIGAQLSSKAVERVRATTCPVVLVDGYSEGNALDSVVTDNVAGARMAVEHLFGAGHREIALLGTEPVCYPSIQARRTGYIEALQARGLATHFIDASYVLTGTVAALGVDYIQRHPEVTALFGANDLITVAFIETARGAGLRIPADVSVVGFDDMDVASLAMPALTTLAIDKALMARAGFALLAHRLEALATDPLTAIVMPRLVERESVIPIG